MQLNTAGNKQSHFLYISVVDVQHMGIINKNTFPEILNLAHLYTFCNNHSTDNEVLIYFRQLKTKHPEYSAHNQLTSLTKVRLKKKKKK